MEHYLIGLLILNFLWRITSKLLDFRFVKKLPGEKLKTLGEFYPGFFDKHKGNILLVKKAKKNPPNVNQLNV